MTDERSPVKHGADETEQQRQEREASEARSYADMVKRNSENALIEAARDKYRAKEAAKDAELREIANGKNAEDKGATAEVIAGVNKALDRIDAISKLRAEAIAPREPEPVEPIKQREPTENEWRAMEFCTVLSNYGVATLIPRKTQAINNRPVRDGWAVNYVDPESEIGLVAVWHGRRHFEAYLEVKGHSDRTQETAAAFARLLVTARSEGEEKA